MKASSVLFSALSIFVVLFLLIEGFFFLLIPIHEVIRVHVVDVFSYSHTFFYAVGGGLCVLALFLGLGFFLVNRKRYLSYKMGCSKAIIDESVIKDYVRIFWRDNFPTVLGEPEVIFKPSGLGLSPAIEIICSLPEEGDKEQLLVRVQNELGVILARRLGYEKEFIITIYE